MLQNVCFLCLRTCVWRLTSLFVTTPTSSSSFSPWCWWQVWHLSSENWDFLYVQYICLFQGLISGPINNWFSSYICDLDLLKALLPLVPDHLWLILCVAPPPTLLTVLKQLQRHHKFERSLFQTGSLVLARYCFLCHKTKCDVINSFLDCVIQLFLLFCLILVWSFLCCSVAVKAGTWLFAVLSSGYAATCCSPSALQS